MAGVILLDAAAATPLDLARLASMSADALCVVVPGHACPDPSTCSGKVNAPVKHRVTQQSHLLAACFHNVGATEVKPFFSHSAEIDVSSTVCCFFQMFWDEAPSPEAWAHATLHPVRCVADAFRAKGIDSPFHQPWGRAFRASGRPSTPQASESLTFQAKVERAILPRVMQASGFNCAYLTPRTWEHRPLPGWGIVWMKGAKPDVEKQALVLAEQHPAWSGAGQIGASEYQNASLCCKPPPATASIARASDPWEQDPSPLAQSAAQEASVKDLQQVWVDMQAMSASIGQQLQSSIDSLKSSQAQQEAQMMQGMAELKALLTESSRKARRTDDKDI